MRDFFDFLKQRQIEFVDFRFTDLPGTWHHMTYAVSAVDEELLTNGILFDASSIQGWKAINESDMLLKPDFGADLANATVDPFSAYPTAIVVCDTFDPKSGAPYNRDPRHVAAKCVKYLRDSGLADEAYLGPEVEYFLFDGVSYRTDHDQTGYELYSDEFGRRNGERDPNNHGCRPRRKGGYFPVRPLDSTQDIRCETLVKLAEMGVKVEKHHHEVASAQHELGIVYNSLLRSADEVQIYKYAVRNTARLYGKTATFMAKPVFDDNGSGMHVHQSLWKSGAPLFSGDAYGGLSEMALYYIGGILKHAKSLNAFTNPTTNSYKRLVPGFEAPVIRAYSLQNRSAACRIPTVSGAKTKRVEVRFPDSTCNPYLAFAAMVMAGLDGIRHKIHPGDAKDMDLFEDKEMAKTLPAVCGSLREALESLGDDHEYLTEGGVFCEDVIDAHLRLKWDEVLRLERHPHPVEFEMYYNA